MPEWLNRDGIQDVIPHREPFLFVDEVVVIYGESARGIIYQPGRILTISWVDSRRMPNLLIIEALAEVGAVAILGMPENRGKIAMLTRLKRWKLRPVFPDGPIELDVELSAARSNFARGLCRASVNGQLLAKGELSCALIDQRI